jgi:hypothetical protein
MSNAFQSMSSASALLKNVYRGGLIDLMNADMPVYRAAEKMKDQYSGYQVIRALRTRRNQGIGAGADGGTLPKIGRSSNTNATITAKFNWLRFGITAGMIKASQSDQGSFVRGFANELKQAYNDFKTDINRQLCFDGTGAVALVNTASTGSSSLVIKGRSTGEPALKYVDVDLTFDIVRSSVVIASGVSVTAISGSPSATTATLTLDQAISTSVGDLLIRSGSLSSEIQGLFYALDGATSGSAYGVDRATALAYQGNVSDVSTAASPILSLAAMQSVFNEGLRRGNCGKYNAIFTDFSSLGYYQKLLTPDKRYVSTKEGDGSFGNKGEFFLEFNGIAMVPDKDMPIKMAFLPSEVLKFYILSELEVADETGSQYIAQSDADAFETRLRFWGNFFNEQPAACAVLAGYTSP